MFRDDAGMRYTEKTNDALRRMGDLVAKRRLRGEFTCEQVACEVGCSADDIQAIEDGDQAIEVGLMLDVLDHLGIELYHMTDDGFLCRLDKEHVPSKEPIDMPSDRGTRSKIKWEDFMGKKKTAPKDGFASQFPIRVARPAR